MAQTMYKTNQSPYTTISIELKSGAHFDYDFSIVIQIWWKLMHFHLNKKQTFFY